MRGAILLALFAGCLKPSAVQCADGRVCPAETTCDTVHGLCLVPEQTEVCAASADGEPCSFSGQLGVCDQGVCVPTSCGDGNVETNEACDDGNVASGDGCRGDCRKIEMCGDEIVDANEDCDDNNTSAVDGCNACRASVWSATPIIGGIVNPATIGIHAPNAIAVDHQGRVYFSDELQYRVRRLDPNGTMTTVAGTGQLQGGSPDGARATSIALTSLRAVAVDGVGNLHIGANNKVLRVDATGIVTTIAGTGVLGFSGDNGPATLARLDFTSGLAIDGLGNLYISDQQNHRVRRVLATTGVITTVAGSTEGFTDNVAGTAAQLRQPAGLAYHDGALYIADRGNGRVRKLDLVTQIITTVAGSGGNTFVDNVPATAASFSVPEGIAFDGAGNMYIAANGDRRVLRVAVADGVLTTVAGGMNSNEIDPDGTPALSANLGDPAAVGADAVGNLYIIDQAFHRIRRVDKTTGTISSVVGNGDQGYFGEGRGATSVPVYFAESVTVDSVGRLVYTDSQHFRVRRIESSGVVKTLAGTLLGFAGDGGPATAARFHVISDVELDGQGNMYIADRNNGRIRRVDGNGIVTTIAGGGASTADGVLATDALLTTPRRIALHAGSVYVADTDDHRVRRIDQNGMITTVAGTGTPGFSGDGAAATAAQLNGPIGIAFDASGNLLIADSRNHRIRRVAAGVITTIAGTGTAGFSGDGGAATSASFDEPAGLAFAPNGLLHIADQRNHRVRKIDANGVITTVAGSGSTIERGDGALATAAGMNAIQDIAFDSAGTMYVADTFGFRIARVDTAGIITTVVGAVDPEDVGPFATGRVADARALVVDPAFTLIAGGGTGIVYAARTASSWLEVVAGRYNHQVDTGNLARFRQRQIQRVISGIAYDSATKRIYASDEILHGVQQINVVDVDDANVWTLAGGAGSTFGASGFAEGQGSSAKFRGPAGLYLDAPAGQLYVADPGNHVIRRIALASFTVTTWAGVPETRGFAGDGGSRTAALFYEPRALTRCPNGDMFIADTGNHRVRRITAGTDSVTTVLGDGVAGSSGEGAPAWTFPVHLPQGLACDADNNLYVTSTNTVRLLPAIGGVVDGNGPVLTIFGEPPRDTYPASVTTCLTGIAAVAPAKVYVVDACAGLMFELALQ